jgi:predicted transcriptional regulator
MACISPDGMPTASGFRILRALKDGLGTPEQISANAHVPLFRARSGLRDMEAFGLVSVQGGKYKLEPKGRELVDTVH